MKWLKLWKWFYEHELVVILVVLFLLLLLVGFTSGKCHAQTRMKIDSIGALLSWDGDTLLPPKVDTTHWYEITGGHYVKVTPGTMLWPDDTVAWYDTPEMKEAIRKEMSKPWSADELAAFAEDYAHSKRSPKDNPLGFIFSDEDTLNPYSESEIEWMAPLLVDSIDTPEVDTTTLDMSTTDPIERMK